MRLRELSKLIGLPVVAASLCCLSPVILLLLGFTTVSFASSLADTLYYGYKWVFRAFGLVALFFSLILYFRKKGVCTLDQAKRRKNEIINAVLMTVITGIAGYVFFLYVVVHYVGVWLNLWE